MPISTLLERTIGELLAKGGAQTLQFIIAQHPMQQQNVVKALVLLAKRQFVDLKEPAGDKRADWAALSVRKLWVMCGFGKAGDVELMRQAAVETLTARTNEFCPQFRIIVLLRNEEEFHALPPICRLLSGNKLGHARLLDLGTTVETDPQLSRDPNTGLMEDSGFHIVEPYLEEWLDYSMVEDAAGDIAELQERIFNSDPTVDVVRYSTKYGRGAPYIRILRDALKFNIVVHTLDLTRSECGDVVGMCLASILYTSRKLRTIVLDTCSLTDVGVAQIAQAVGRNEFVRSLTLSRNPSMTDVSLVALAAMFSGPAIRLEALDISYNNSLYDARFEWSPSAIDALWDALGAYQKLQRICISSCSLTGAHLREAASRWLSKGNELTYVDVSHNSLGDEVIAACLSMLRRVRILDLTHVQLSASGFRAVGYVLANLGLPIEDLRLDANNASLVRPFDTAFLGSAFALPDTMAKVVLDEETPAARYVMDSLLGNRVLTKLSFSRSFMGDDAVTALCEMLINRQCAVRDVDISGNCNVEEASAHKIKELLVGGYYAAAASSQPESQSVPQGGAEGQSKQVALNNKIDHPLVWSLNLANNSTAIGERALLALYQNEGLRRLSLYNMGLVDAMLLPLNEAMRRNAGLRIEYLDVGRNRLWLDGVFHIAEHLRQSAYLKFLSLGDTWSAYDDEAGRPTSLSNSREQGLYYLQPLLSALQAPGCPLEELDLSGNDISVTCARGIATAIASNTTLKAVRLYRNPLLLQFLEAGSTSSGGGNGAEGGGHTVDAEARKGLDDPRLIFVPPS